MSTVRLGTRASPLALTQSRSMARLLEATHPGLRVELVEITTTGDTVQNKALSSFGGAGVFVKELESALLDHRVDFAVHSLKDMPTRQPDPLVLGAIVGREDCRDAAVIRGGARFEDLPPGSVIGSGSTRRRAQLKALYPHLAFAEIRGNVDTRLRKVDEGAYAGTILALAGLKRLGLDARATYLIPLTDMLPAPGQGALGLECRADDQRLRDLLGAIHQADVAASVNAERAVLEALGGGCHLPLGALGTIDGTALRLQAVLGLPDGTALVRADERGSIDDPRELGKRLGDKLLASGGVEILKRLENLPKS